MKAAKDEVRSNLLVDGLITSRHIIGRQKKTIPFVRKFSYVIKQKIKIVTLFVTSILVCMTRKQFI